MIQTTAAPDSGGSRSGFLSSVSSEAMLIMVGGVLAFLAVLVCVCAMFCYFRMNHKRRRSVFTSKEGDNTTMKTVLTDDDDYDINIEMPPIVDLPTIPHRIQLPGPGAEMAHIPSISSMASSNASSFNKRISSTVSSQSMNTDHLDHFQILTSVNETHEEALRGHQQGGHHRGEATDVEADSDDDMYSEHKENVNCKSVDTPNPNRDALNISAASSQYGDDRSIDNIQNWNTTHFRRGSVDDMYGPGSVEDIDNYATTPCSSTIGRSAIFTIGDVDQMRGVQENEEEEEDVEGNETIVVEPAMYNEFMN